MSSRLALLLRAVLLRLLRLTIAVGRGRAGLQWCGVVVRWLVANPWLRQRLLGQELALLHRFAVVVGTTAIAPAEAEQRHAQLLLLQPLLYRLVEQPSRAEVEPLFELVGEAQLQAALGRGQGVLLLHSHLLLVRTFWFWLRWQHADPGPTLWGWSKTRPAVERDDPAVRTVAGAAELATAREQLLAGGFVHVLADGYKGQHPLTLSYCGRERPFQTGFAELALLTGAAILPVAVTLTPQLRLRIQIGPALTPAPSSQPHAVRVAQLVEGYADWLQRIYRTQPYEMAPYHMRRHLELPHAVAAVRQ